jgi:hypothetical protein
MPLWKIYYLVSAFTAEGKDDFAEKIPGRMEFFPSSTSTSFSTNFRRTRSISVASE